VAVPFTTISVADGVSMNHRGMRMSLVSRELIADSIEAVVRAHCYDALVGFAGCEKRMPRGSFATRWRTMPTTDEPVLSFVCEA
jgi:dihydroxyacid dehydratase/phosphogluconate dehydratase